MKLKRIALTTAAIVVGYGTLMYCDQSQGQEPTLQTLTQPYLDKTNVVREEYLISHYLFRDNKGVTHFNKTYLLDKDLLIAQYNFTGVYETTKNGIIKMLFPYPTQYGFSKKGDDKRVWWLDPQRNGIDGDEIRQDDLEKMMKDAIKKSEEKSI